MDNLQTTSYENILTVIRRWPLSRRLILVQDVLKTLASELAVPDSTSSQLKRSTLPEAYGLLSGSHMPPSDAEIQEWLRERRLEKYG
ncbi:MAG: hypothetical protein JW953_02965 [Anaerolineae bacterium]|nr:hypothetical protein [Anaerolineae bacterium]